MIFAHAGPGWDYAILAVALVATGALGIALWFVRDILAELARAQLEADRARVLHDVVHEEYADRASRWASTMETYDEILREKMR